MGGDDATVIVVSERFAGAMESLILLPDTMQQAAALLFLEDEEGEEETSRTSSSSSSSSSFTSVVPLRNVDKPGSNRGLCVVLEGRMQTMSPNSQCKPAKKWTLMDNASNLLTSLLSGGSLGSMPIVEGAVSDLFRKPLFFALYDWFLEHGPVYKLAFGPKAFVVVSDPIVTHHILRDNAFGYDKVHDFAENNDSVLLVVIPTALCRNVSASRALKLAQDLDPDGTRTIV